MLLVGKVLPWLSLLWLVLQKKTTQFGIFIFVGPGYKFNVTGSKCDGDCILL